jgi:hypothetical protein
MSDDDSFTPVGIDFHPRVAHDVVAPIVEDGEGYPVADRRVSPFSGYVRMLSPEGGVLIFYKDQDRGRFITTLRGFAWTVATGLGGWLIFFVSPLNILVCVPAFGLAAALAAFAVRRPIEVAHSVEIRSDIMIVDGQDVFYAEDIGDNWPELQMKDDNPDRLVIAGVCGIRFIEFMTVNRIDKNDRTPEVLADDLEAAMEQLWGRREVTFEAGL